MRSLVTGATGFIGSHLAEMLRARGHSVRLLVRSEKRLVPELREGYEIVKGDVTQSPDELRKAVEGVDYVFHVAGMLFGRTEREIISCNTIGTRNLCEAVKQSGSGVLRFLFCSSQAAAGPSEDSRHIIDEDSIEHPVTYYGRSKLLAEKVMHQYAGDFPYTILRPVAVYGPRDKGILEFFKWMSKGYALRFGSQEMVFSLVHGREVARAFVEAAVHEDAVGETFFITDPEPYHLSAVMYELRQILNPRKNRTLAAPIWAARMYARVNDGLQFVLRKPMLPNSDKINELVKPYWICTGQKARDVLGFEAQVALREGLRETADWYLKEGWIKVK